MSTTHTRRYLKNNNATHRLGILAESDLDVNGSISKDVSVESLVSLFVCFKT